MDLPGKKRQVVFFTKNEKSSNVRVSGQMNLPDKP